MVRFFGVALLTALLAFLPTRVRAQESTPDPEAADAVEVDGAIIAAAGVAAGTPFVLGAISVGLARDLGLRGPDLAAATLPMLALSALVPSIGWWAIGESRAGWVNLGFNLGALALGVAGSLWFAEATGAASTGDTVLEGLAWTSGYALSLSSLVALTQVDPARAGWSADPAIQRRAMAAGTGAMSALTAGALASAFAFSDTGPVWDSLGPAIALTGLSPALSYAAYGEWQLAAESLLVGAGAVAFAALVAAIGAPLVTTESPELTFDDAFAQGFALGSAFYVPLASVVHALLRQ